MVLNAFVCKDESYLVSNVTHFFYCEQIIELPFEARDITTMHNFRGQKN